MNLKNWRAERVWKDSPECVGNLPKSLTGTLDNPVISEAGRRFLADLLSRLTRQPDAQPVRGGTIRVQDLRRG